MADVPRVPLGRPSASSWLPGVATGAAVVLVLMVLKPWVPAAPPETATPMPTFYVGPIRTEQPGPRAYDPRLFGLREPDPAWELWPAGYVVRFGLAGPVRVQGHDGPFGPGPSADPNEPAASNDASASPTPQPSGGASAVPPAAGASPPPSPPPSPPDPTGGPARPENVVEIGPADHLVALGINTPLEVRIERIAMWRIEAGGEQVVPIVRLPTFFESNHFFVIAPERPRDPGQPDEWLPGLYRLDLFTATGDVREVVLLVDPPLS